MTTSRRELFSSLLKPFVRTGDLSREPQTASSQWLAIGTMGAFPVGSVTTINQNRHVVCSSEQGLWAMDANVQAGTIETRRPLAIDDQGVISIDPAGAWPAGAVLNIMTGTYTIVSEELS